MVRDHFKLGHDWRGDSWFAGFLARHRLELHSGHLKAIAEKRTRKEILDYVKRFVSVMGRFLKEHTFTAETVYNADESLLHAVISSAGNRRIEAVSKAASNMKLPRGMHNGSILPFFNAAGRCPLLVIILRRR